MLHSPRRHECLLRNKSRNDQVRPVLLLVGPNIALRVRQEAFAYS